MHNGRIDLGKVDASVKTSTNLERTNNMPNVLIFDGRVAQAPTLTRPNNKAVCKFTLIRNEYAGTDDDGNARDERQVSLQFTAFNARAEAIAKHVMEGDQLVVTARLSNNNYQKEGQDVYGFNFTVEDFDFGAPGPRKRAQLAERAGG